MRNLLIALLISIFFLSCKKDDASNITYEVTLINSSSWHGAYLNENAQVVGISDAPDNWKYSFKNTNNLSVVTLNAYSDGINSDADAEMKIYINGSVVTQGLSSVSPQIQYLFP